MDSSRQKLVGVQILRGIAATAVAWHHLLEISSYLKYGWHPPDWLIRLGAAGVDVFFVISGFIMVFVNFAPGRDCSTPGLFLLKRAVRIYPFYWCCCLLMLGLKLVGFYRSVNTGSAFVLNSLLLLPLHKTYLIGVAWTLVYELYFYLLFALTLPLRSVKLSVLGTAALILVVYALAPFAPLESLRIFLGSPIVFEFCFGMLLGWYVTRREAAPHATSALVVGMGALIVATLLIPAPNTNGLVGMQRVLGWGLPAVLCVWSAVHWAPAASRLTRSAILVGDASYAIYLTHVFVMVVYAKLLRSSPALASASQWPLTSLGLLVALLLGVTAHLIVEKRVTRLAAALASSPRGSGTAGTRRFEI